MKTGHEKVHYIINCVIGFVGILGCFAIVICYVILTIGEYLKWVK
jgi:hypothetical protein